MAWVVFNPSNQEVLCIDLGGSAPEGVSSQFIAGVTAWPAAPSPTYQLRLNAGALTWVDMRTLADAKARAWAAIKKQRSASEFGTFIWDGSVFDCDAESQLRIQFGVLAAMQSTILTPFSEAWPLTNLSTRTLGGADMIAVGKALVAHVFSKQAMARSLYAQINAATSLAQVDAVNWT